MAEPVTNGVREPEEDEASVRRLLEEQGLRRLAEEKEAILSQSPGRKMELQL